MADKGCQPLNGRASKLLTQCGFRWAQRGTVRAIGVGNSLRRIDDMSLLVVPQALSAVRELPSLARSARDDLDETLLGPSPEMAAVRAWVQQAAQLEATVLIEGETGTGKEVIAQALHALSGRRGPLIAVNVADLSRELAEAELFGVVRGAYTGATDRPGRLELAHEGTLFLDEAGDLPRGVQARLLRVLETGRFSRVGDPRERGARFRLILAVQQSPGRLLAEQRWRRDFLFRVGRLHLALPPLSARGRDVLFLANHFLARLGAGPLPLEAHAELLEHLWPGNVRELATAVERAVFLAGTRPVAARDIVAAARSLLGGASATPDERVVRRRTAQLRGQAGERADVVRAAERAHLEALLQRHAFQVGRAAQTLGISKAYLYRRLRTLGISLPTRQRSGASVLEGH